MTVSPQANVVTQVGTAVAVDDPTLLIGRLTCTQAFTYAAGVLQTEAITYDGRTYTRTYGYTGADLTSIGAWVVS